MVFYSGCLGEFRTFVSGDCQASLTVKVVLACVLKSIFRQVRASLNFLCGQR